jgi:hypothetical protein
MLRWILLLSAAVLLVSCGKGAGDANDAKVDLDSDPYALLPGSAVAVANLDARAMFASSGVGAQMGALAAKLVPLGDDAGFQASRDVDRVVVGFYATTGADMAAIVSGRFDTGKIATAASAKPGGAITPGMYAGRTTYASSGGMFCVLTAKTVVAGTGDGVRRVLDRIQGGKLDRAITPWMIETLDTKGAEAAFAADFASQPIAAASLGQFNVPWLKGMRVARVLGDFQNPGMNVAATLTYGDPTEAQGAADGIRMVDGWLKLLGPLLGGVRLENLDVKNTGNDMSCKFAVDDGTLKTLIGLVPRFLTAQR